MKYEFVIKGGTVIDPGQNLHGILDVALANGKIAALESDIPATQAQLVVEASGKLVTPGLIDLHTHIYWGATSIGLEPDPICARSGVTTIVDAGSANAYTFAGFRRFIIEPAQSRIFAFLHVTPYPRPDVDPIAYAKSNMGATIKVIEENRDVILGIKLFVAGNMVGQYGLGLLQVAREIADRVQLPLMAHIGFSPPSLGEILALLHRGDIVTHSFHGHDNRIIDDAGNIRPEVLKARERGVILDIGHGAGSFSFETAKAMLKQHQYPDVISTDLYTANINGPVYDLPTTLSKFLNLGMSLEEVISAATERPAQIIHRGEGLGKLQIGGFGDIAILHLLEGEFEFFDCHRQKLVGNQKLVNYQTICQGKLMSA
ncbi:amidohydrolase/deacetylase family metallohydrolase [Candidatus Poribacteria bacterium]|nr:amidohydrolase/deacetylase family metallohydrolase [Candidatus Poribacteria bacterium]